MQNALKCANLGENLICHSHNVNTNIFVDFALLKLSLCMTLYRKNNSVFFLTCLSSLAPKRESQTGELAEAPSQMLLHSARNITIVVLCVRKRANGRTHSHKNTHKNIPLLLGRQPLTGPLQPLSQ